MNFSKIPERKDVPASDMWNLTSLYKSDDDWEKDLLRITELSKLISAKKGSINTDKSGAELLNSLRLYAQMEEISEAAGTYAFLLTAGDASDSVYQDKQGRYTMCAAAAETEISFFIPEIQSIEAALLQSFIDRADFSEFSIFLKKLLHIAPYILSDKEERIIALQTETAQTAQRTFSMLTNVDIDYGRITAEDGTEKQLSQSTFSVFLESPDREVRKQAYTQFYKAFDGHKNTIASLYTGSVNQDVYKARARGYNSAIHKALYQDNVPLSVYDNLINTIRGNLAPLHRYYSLRKKILKLDELRHYDVYTPLTADVKKITPYNDAVEILRQALSPLGSEYTDTLCSGLLSGWADKYENKGKRSGAFSSGAYKSWPYILLNYKEDVLRDVFTLAHEGGHSMHSWYSAKSNPFINYSYTIFEAEVASTFNEELLFNFLLKTADNDNVKAFLICNKINDILATLFRQTMFAEFEKKTHELVESGTPLSADVLRSVYRDLLSTYFGPEMVFEAESDLECLRIPHFYNAFYVYKYATGISASLALSDRVLNGGQTERNDYFKFLQSGGSRYPIDSLRAAGVDMEKTEPIQAAVNKFSFLVDEFEKIVNA